MRVRMPLVVVLFLTIFILAACGDDPSNVNVEASLHGPNVAPSIALKGPDFPGNSFTAADLQNLAFWVVVTDGNGLDDIAGVFMDIGSIQMNGVIARPDISSSPPNYCDHGPDFTDNNDIDISAALPATFPEFTNIRLVNAGDGVYESPGMVPAEPTQIYGLMSLLDLEDASADFTPTDLVCIDFFDGYFVFNVNPPIVATAQNVFITQVDITLRDITVKVYDVTGATASVSYPDIRGVWMAAPEETTQP